MTPADGARKGSPALNGAHAGVAHPGLVRLLFLVFIAYWLVGAIVRKDVRQPYPGLSMPPFGGIGLNRMTKDEGETTLVRIKIRFADQTTTEVTRSALFGNDFYPSVLPDKYFVLGREGAKDSGLPDDAKQFLAERLEKLYTGKAVAAVTFQAVRVSFPLDRPNDRMDVGMADERVVPFSP